MSDLILNRYQPIEEAGSGGFASVVVAWDTRIRRKVAIKCMPLDEVYVCDAASPEEAQPRAEFPQHFAGSILLDDKLVETMDVPGLEEARMAARLSDSHIVAVYDFEIQDSTAYLILEYVEGITLGDLIAQCPHQITANIVAAVFRAVSRALEVAHKNHVLHLDIKPHNVLIDYQGKVKVADFGLARLVGEAGFGEAALGGTIGYMPPEQMHREPLDERCDEWALASLTYEMIVGQNPFRASTIEQAEERIYSAELVLPSLCMPGIHESIDDILFCALDPDHDERYDSVADFAHECQQCLGDAKKGVKELVALMTTSEDSEEEPEPILEPVARKKRKPITFGGMPTGVRDGLGRVFGLILSGFIAAFALTNFSVLDGWSSPVSWGVMAAFVVVGGIVPSVGIALALEFLGLVLFMHQAVLPALALMGVTALWWFFAARKGVEEADCGVSAALLGSVGFAPLSPLLSGYALNVKHALMSAGFSGFLAVLFAGFGSCSLVSWNIFKYASLPSGEAINASLAAVMQYPSTWIILASWLIAAAISALLSGRKSVVLGVLGMVVATAVLFVGLVFGTVFNTGGKQLAPDMMPLIFTALSGVLGVLLCALGAPAEGPFGNYADDFDTYDDSHEDGFDDRYYDEAPF